MLWYPSGAVLAPFYFELPPVPHSSMPVCPSVPSHPAFVLPHRLTLAAFVLRRHTIRQPQVQRGEPEGPHDLPGAGWRDR